MGAPEEVGYSSKGWKTNDDLTLIGGDAARRPTGVSLNALLSASNCFTISASSERAFFTFIHFVRINGSSSVLRCLLIWAVAPSKKITDVS
uniref:Katanin p60 ATPase-containing subunit A1 n=1 Tax=Rhizophora mucronata TaxID=61149 RepID=A0A2P2MFH6_RHIMU